ncbi:MAG: AAA family ATPase [Planctomycetota bacterium]
MTRDFRAEAEAFADYLLADDSKGSRRRVGDKVIGRCPLPDHEDKSPSFGFDVAKDASACSCSEATGKGSALRARLGWKPEGANGSTAPRSAAPIKSPAPCYGSLDAAALALSKRIEGPEAGRWTYHRADGSELFAVLRFNVTKTGDDGMPFSTKEYRPVRRDVDGWRVGDPPAPLPLYRLPLLGKSRLVVYVEGEKCAEALAALGFTVTTNAHGANAADKSDFAPLAGRDVRILPDADKPGEALALDVANRLSKLSPPARSRIVRLPGIAGLGGGADVVDWIEWRRKTGSSDEGIVGELTALFDAGGEAPPETQTGTEPVLLRADSIPAKPLAWTWPGWIPSGKPAIWVGLAGLGKTMLLCDLAARITKGAEWPDGSGFAPLGSVIIISAEDDPGDTLIPRLMAAGADLARVNFLQMVKRPDGKTRAFTLADVEDLTKSARALGDLRLVVVDPVSAYLGDVDSHNNAEVRAALVACSEFAAKSGAVLLFITHPPKGAITKAVYAASGSGAFGNAPRSVVLVAEDREDPTRRLVAMAKINLAKKPKTRAYRIATKTLPDRPDLGEIPFAEWLPGTVDVTAEEIVAADAKGGKETRADKHARADAFMKDKLAGGPVHSVEVVAAGSRLGFSDDALREALKRLGGRDRREGAGEGSRVVWELPTSDFPPGRKPGSTEVPPHTSEFSENGKYAEEGGVL